MMLKFCDKEDARQSKSNSQNFVYQTVSSIDVEIKHGLKLLWRCLIIFFMSLSNKYKPNSTTKLLLLLFGFY